MDIETLDLLESLLAEYTGTLFLVSHDRAFLDNVVTQVIVLDGEGGVMENAGGYSDWVRYLESKPNAFEESARSAELVTATPESIVKKPAPAPIVAGRPEKMSFKETRELETLPMDIEKLEAEQGAIALQMADPVIYQGLAEAVKVLQARHSAIEQELERAMARWEVLEQKRARLAG